MNQTDHDYGILEAAKILQVTDKTIRNYINRGFLKPDKWNGSWRISYTEISGLFWKKFGKRLDRDEKALRTNIQELNERNAQLEGSAASGWTEARMLKEELEKARTELAGAREAEMKAREDAGRVNQLVQPGPALAAEPLDHAIG